jgi:mannan endo-1,4-beta-mannosidase
LVLSMFSSSRTTRPAWILGSVLLGLAASCAHGAAPAVRPGVAEQPRTAETMYVQGRHIYSAAGERVVLRGVNEMFAWASDRTGSWILPEIAKTGANGVRIVTTTTFTPADLDAVIRNAIDNGMVPMPECHSATGRWDRLQSCVDYWIRPEIAAVINRHERWVLLNVANEAGDSAVTAQQFLDGYRSAITQIREAGIRVPLVIDGADWGKEYRNLLASWPALNAHDPERAIIVSAHTYWIGSEEEQKNDYRYIIETVTREEIPFVIGEGPTSAGWDCKDSPYAWAMTELERAEIGWLTWSWGAMRNGDCRDPGRFDMTTDGRFGNWMEDWGRLMAVDHPASIRNTSRRPCSIPNAGENCVRPDAAGAVR